MRSFIFVELKKCLKYGFASPGKFFKKASPKKKINFFLFKHYNANLISCYIFMKSFSNLKDYNFNSL